jgi:hypothetical protein
LDPWLFFHDLGKKNGRIENVSETPIHYKRNPDNFWKIITTSLLLGRSLLTMASCPKILLLP